MLEAREVTASYGKTVVLQELSARFRPGCLTALVGPNGCGKSTLLKAIMGFLPVTGGEVLLNGSPVLARSRRALAREIAWLPQESLCPEHMTLGELVELSGYARTPLIGGPSEADRALFRRALETVGLSDMAHLPVAALSGGQRQRAWIAMVLAQDTPVVLMDEPVNHLDVRYQYQVLRLIRDMAATRGKTVVAVLHDLNLAAAFADEAVMMRAGRIVAAGPVREVVTEANVAEVFAIETEIFERAGRLVCLPRLAAPA